MLKIDFSGKTVLVCGSTQGIGLASAIMFAQNGANVVLLARNKEKLEEVVASLPKSGNQHHKYLVADFQEPEQIRDEILQVLGPEPKVDILINNTGGPAPGPAHTADPLDFEKAFSMHLLANHNLAQLVLPHMKRQSWGRIINIISTSVKAPLPGLGVSNTIRGAVASWSKTLANELGGYGITVNNVLPGATKTERLFGLIKSKAAKNNISEEEVERQMKGEIPAARFANPEEVAAAVLFLSSDAAAYINGTSLPVDGGRIPSL